MSREIQVSVLVPSYQHESFVAQAVESVLEQSGVDLEVLAIDDGSTDGSLARLRAIGDDRLQVIAQENRGLSRTLNRGLALARGRWVKMLPSDDLLEPGALARQLQMAGEDDLVVFSLPTVVDADNCPLSDPAPQAWFDLEAPDVPSLRRSLVARNPLCAPGALFLRDAALEAGGFDPSLRIAQDYDLWLRLLECGGARHLPERLVRVRWHGGNQSGVVTSSSESERAYALVGTLVRCGMDWWAGQFGNQGRVALAEALVASGLREAIPFARSALVAHRAAGGSLVRSEELRALLDEAPELIRGGAWRGDGETEAGEPPPRGRGEGR